MLLYRMMWRRRYILITRVMRLWTLCHPFTLSGRLIRAYIVGTLTPLTRNLPITAEFGSTAIATSFSNSLDLRCNCFRSICGWVSCMDGAVMPAQWISSQSVNRLGDLMISRFRRLLTSLRTIHHTQNIWRAFLLYGFDYGVAGAHALKRSLRILDIWNPPQ